MVEDKNAELAALTDKQKRNLRLTNLLLGALHFAQGILILILGVGFKALVTADYIGNPFSTTYEPKYAIALFFFVSSAGHWTLAAPYSFEWYVRNLARHINYERWFEYALSASIMLIVIASLVGITDIVTLIYLFALDAAMNFFGLEMEQLNMYTPKTKWTPFILGAIIGIVPWLGLFLYFGNASPNPPAFVYAIFASLAVIYALFPINMGLQYAHVGPWRSYLNGEYGYMYLSLIAKSLLAWQVYAGTVNSPVLYPT